MTTNQKLRRSIQLALAGGLTAALSAPMAVAQDEDDEEARELDRVQVTGSRISRADIEGALPVTTIDREDIELSGQANAADLLRNLSFNSQGSPRPASGTTAQAQAGMSMRGLGTSRTLILVDGRRLPIGPDTGTYQNLNQIPQGAIERIEVLSDGASAVYGSDAIGGVVNIITRSDFTGVEAMYGRSFPEREGGDTEEGHILMGHEGTRGNIMAGVNYSHRDIYFERDREWSRGGESSFSNNFYANSDMTGDFEHPQFGSVVPGEGCTFGAFEIRGEGEDSWCNYDFTEVAADEAEMEQNNLFVRGEYEINMDWEMYMNASVDRMESFGRYAPVPSSPWPGGLPVAEPGSPNHPATPEGDGGLNPEWDDSYYQQYENDDVYFAHRFDALGNRDTFIDSNVYDLDVGARGRVGDWDIDFGVRHNEYQTYDLGENYVVGDLAQGLIDDGTYNIYDPTAIDDEDASQMIATITRDNHFVQQEVYGTVGTDLFMLPAGPVSAVFGAEYREEDYQEKYDPLQEGGQIVGSAGNTAAGGREVAAGFFETVIPVTEDFEFDIAGRYDEYSDYGSDFSPKIAGRWQPMDELTLRGSYGEGFRAPNLPQITTEPSFSAAGVIDAPTGEALAGDPDANVQVTTYSIANPDLESENSEQFALGAAFQPTDWFEGSIDYYNIEINNRIAAVGIQTIRDCLEGDEVICPPDLAEWTAGEEVDQDPNVDLGLGLARDPEDGNITFGQTGTTNMGTLETDGLDLNLTARYEAGTGRIAHNIQWTYVNSFKDDGDENIRNHGYPEHRGQIQTRYAIDDYEFSWNLHYIDSQEETQDPADAGTTESWITHDLQANWYTPWDGRVTVGVRNALDDDPPLDAGYADGYNRSLYHGYGREPYFRYTQNF